VTLAPGHRDMPHDRHHGAGPAPPHSHAASAAPGPSPDHLPGHRHAHAGHHHGDATRRALWIAFGLTAGFAVIEAVGGWLAGSLALVSDAGHMATDAAAFAVALFANAVARRPPSARASYGHARAEVLAAFINALAMLVLIVFIAVEAVRRLLDPVPVAGGVVMVIALAGMAVNVAAAWVLSRATDSINARGALLHVFGDLLGSVAALVAGAVIHFTGWTPVDPLLSLLVVVLILRSTWRLLGESSGVLLERVPAHLDFDAIGRALAALPGVAGVHDLHVWHLSAERVALSAHVALDDAAAWPRVLATARGLLLRDFGIDHVTLQPSWPVGAPAGRAVPVAVRAVAGAQSAAPVGPVGGDQD